MDFKYLFKPTGNKQTPLILSARRAALFQKGADGTNATRAPTRCSSLSTLAGLALLPAAVFSSSADGKNIGNLDRGRARPTDLMESVLRINLNHVIKFQS